MSWVVRDFQGQDILVTDLPELEDTGFPSVLREKGRLELVCKAYMRAIERARAEGYEQGYAEGFKQGYTEGMVKVLVQFGRQLWGAEPEGISDVLRTLSTEELDALIDPMSKNLGWKAFRDLIPVTRCCVD